MYEYCVDDPVNYVDPSGLQGLSTPVSRHFYISEMSAAQRARMMENYGKYTTGVLSGVSVALVVVGTPFTISAAGVIGGISVGISFINGEYGDVALGVALLGIGAQIVNPSARIAYALAQFGYELLPDGRVIKIEYQDPMSVQDNTAVAKKTCP